MTEAQLEKWAKGEAKKRGVLMYKFRSPQKRGVPDQILFYRGATLLVEFKSPSGKGVLSPLQQKEIATFRAARMAVAVVDTKVGFILHINELINRGNALDEITRPSRHQATTSCYPHL